MRFVTAFLVWLTLFSYLFALDWVQKTYQTTRVNSVAPKIDGRTDDPAWQHVTPESSFVQRNPVEGDPPTEKTVFRICYDQSNLYVLIEAFDSQPEKIAARLARRDDLSASDFVSVILDSYYDRRTAFEFSVNAAGVQSDAVFANDSGDDDESWDPVWEAKTRITKEGWIAEMRIPLSQLRFASGESQTWGLQVYRNIYRKQELLQWQPIPKQAPGYISFFGKMTGIRNLKSHRRIELLPYTVTSYNRYPAEKGNPFADGSDGRLDFGLDGKIGLGGNLTMDITVNPDFGQVEADPSEVNLSAFETFFKEKRPFFVEGKNIFNFNLAMGDNPNSRETLFYSRRIGRRPQYSPDLEDDEYADEQEQTSILGAVKLSGKTASGWSVGVLDAVTAEEKAEIEKNGKRRKVTTEPLSNYFVGRLQKDFDGGNTTLGMMATAANRNINQPYLDFLNRSAYTGGVDFFHRWGNKKYYVDGKFAFSHIRGHKEAILEAQTASARYFQRPDADYLTLDSSRTSLSGHGGTFSLGYNDQSHWMGAASVLWRSPGFELNDLGYLRQADKIMQFVWVGYRINNPVGIFRRVGVNFNQWNGWNFGGEKRFSGGNINWNAQFLNYWGIWAGINREMDGLDMSGLRGGPSLREEGGWNGWYGFYTDNRRKLRLEFGGSFYNSDDQISNVRRIFSELDYKPMHNIELEVEPFIRWNTWNLQYVETYTLGSEDVYLLGRIKQKTAGVELRLNYSLTPKLSIQYYGQPFISSGDYSHFKRITRPRAGKYEDRFHEYREDQIQFDPTEEIYSIDDNGDGTVDFTLENPDFNFKEYRSNLVVRWEYRPGSQIYLVWSQSRSASDEYGDFDLGRDFRDLFETRSDNVFLVKVNHWFSI